MKEISKLILKNLIHNEEYSNRVAAFLKKEYFENNNEQKVFETIQRYIEKYNASPSIEAIYIELKNDKSINEELEKNIDNLISDIKVKEEKNINIDWLINSTEQFCKERSIYNGLMESIDIYQNKDKKNVGVIPDILKDALSISFDVSIGHDYIKNAEDRYSYYTKEEYKVPFRLDYMNKITKRGFSRKTMNLILAGCVDIQTMVKVRINEKMIIDIQIGNIRNYLKNKFKVEIWSADGFQSVKKFVDKGLHIGFEVTCKSDGRKVIVNENHLFETPYGWEFAKNLGDCEILMDTNKYESCIVQKTDQKHHIVDIEVDHSNHRYFANGFSSHNTHVGKTAFMCQLAADNLIEGNNVLYITLEMAEEEIAARIDANLLDIPMSDIRSLPKDMFMRKINKLKSNVEGRLIIKEYPTATIHTGHIRTLLNELSLKQNFVPDIIYIDYLNLLLSSRLSSNGNANSFTYYKFVSEELRGLFVEKNVVGVSSSQFNRSNSNSSDPELDGISESFGVNFGGDFICALIATKELKERDVVLLKQLKNRYDDMNRIPSFFMGFDRMKQRFYDTDDPEGGIIREDTSVMDKGDFTKKEKERQSDKFKKKFNDFKF